MGLYENMVSETVERMALRKPVLVKRGGTVRQAILEMRQRKLGCAIVVDNNQRPLGMLTESMITQQLASGKLDLDAEVETQMSDGWPWVSLTDPVADVLVAMQINNVRFLCVVDAHGKVVGLTGQKGLMEYIAEHYPAQVMTQPQGDTIPHKREGA